MEPARAVSAKEIGSTLHTGSPVPFCLRALDRRAPSFAVRPLAEFSFTLAFRSKLACSCSRARFFSPAHASKRAVSLGRLSMLSFGFNLLSNRSPHRRASELCVQARVRSIARFIFLSPVLFTHSLLVFCWSCSVRVGNTSADSLCVINWNRQAIEEIGVWLPDSLTTCRKWPLGELSKAAEDIYF